MWYCALWPLGIPGIRTKPVVTPCHRLAGCCVALATVFVVVPGSISLAETPLDPSLWEPVAACDSLDQPAWLTDCAPNDRRSPWPARGDQGDDEDEAEDDGDQLTPCIEELFLGTVVYPQEQNELQLTWGGYHSVETDGDWQTLFELEYGITDRLQIGLECPTEIYSPEDSYRGVRNLGVELYYNFYSDRQQGRAYGVGFGWGAPVDAPRDEARAHEYEPYFVAFQEFDCWAVNVFGGLEIEDSLEPSEATETTGNVAVGLIGPCEGWTPLLEVGVEIASDQTAVRLAPGLYRHQIFGPVDVAASLPIGLEGDVPKFGVYLMAIVELDPSESGPRSGSRRGGVSRRRH